MSRIHLPLRRAVVVVVALAAGLLPATAALAEDTSEPGDGTVIVDPLPDDGGQVDPDPGGEVEPDPGGEVEPDPDGEVDPDPGGEVEPPADDLDWDGLTNDQEAELGTDPENADTDGDGALDGDEVAAGTDPRDASSVIDIGDPPYEEVEDDTPVPVAVPLESGVATQTGGPTQVTPSQGSPHQGSPSQATHGSTHAPASTQPSGAALPSTGG